MLSVMYSDPGTAGCREARVWPFLKKMRLLLDLSRLSKKKKGMWLTSLHLSFLGQSSAE